MIVNWKFLSYMRPPHTHTHISQAIYFKNLYMYIFAKYLMNPNHPPKNDEWDDLSP